MFWELRYAASGSIWGARSITTVLLLSNITRNIWIWRGVNFFLRRKFAEKLQEEQKKKLPICWFSSCCRVQNLFIFAWEFNTRHLNIGDYLALSPLKMGGGDICADFPRIAATFDAKRCIRSSWHRTSKPKEYYLKSNGKLISADDSAFDFRFPQDRTPSILHDTDRTP